MTAPRHGRWPRALLAPILIVLQIGGVTVAPVVHARAESLDGLRALERQHSNSCTTIHVEARCSLAAFDHLFAPPPRALHVEARHHVKHRDAPEGPAFVRLPDLSTAAGRAPPRLHTA